MPSLPGERTRPCRNTSWIPSTGSTSYLGSLSPRAPPSPVLSTRTAAQVSPISQVRKYTSTGSQQPGGILATPDVSRGTRPVSGPGSASCALSRWDFACPSAQATSLASQDTSPSLAVPRSNTMPCNRSMPRAAAPPPASAMATLCTSKLPRAGTPSSTSPKSRVPADSSIAGGAPQVGVSAVSHTRLGAHARAARAVSHAQRAGTWSRYHERPLVPARWVESSGPMPRPPRLALPSPPKSYSGAP